MAAMRGLVVHQLCEDLLYVSYEKTYCTAAMRGPIARQLCEDQL